MDYLFIKWTHILGATLLFGAGLGTAFQMYMAHHSGDVRAIAVAAKNTVLADWLFTLTSGVLQPVTGILLIVHVGWDPFSPWLIVTYSLYALALACWVPVVWLQIRMRDLAVAAAAAGNALPEEYFRRMKWWFALGWPAFIALIAVFWLMVAKPAL